MEGFRRLFIDRKQRKEGGGTESQEASLRDESNIPIVNATLKECARLADQPESVEQVRSFLEEYFEEAIANTQIFSSEKSGAAFPYTIVRLRDLAAKLYEKLGSPVEKPSEHQDAKPNMEESGGLEEKTAKGPRRDFIFGTFFDVKAGHPYHWIEHGIDQAAKKLPEALRQLRRGEQPEDVEIYGIGSPAGELGAVSPEFIDRAGDHPFEQFGDLYAEFIHSLNQGAERNDAPGIIHLWGVSMGASLAATTGTSLMRQGFATQSREEAQEKSLPFVRVDMNVPVATSESPLRKWQIPAGFVTEFAIQKLSGSEYNNDVAAAEKDFTGLIYERLRERGIVTHLSDEDLRSKKMLVSRSIEEMRSGIPIQPDLKTNEIIGIYDPLMYSGERRSRAEIQSEEHAGSLGEHLIEAPSDNRRQFAVNMTHTPAVVRENYFKRLIRAGDQMRQLSGR